jgi:cytochrome c
MARCSMSWHITAHKKNPHRGGILMAFRALTAGSVLALALAACSDGAPEATDTAAPLAAMAEAEIEAPAAETEAVVEEVAAETATAEVAADKAKEAAPVAAVAAAAPVAAPVAEIVKVAEVTAPASFARCVACHTTNKGGEDKLGPNLYGVYGKPAAQGSFGFSAAYKEAGLTMDEATLHKWLENPKALVPGNRMSFPGIKDAAKRQEIIDYLKQQS